MLALVVFDTGLEAVIFKKNYASMVQKEKRKHKTQKFREKTVLRASFIPV